MTAMRKKWVWCGGHLAILLGVTLATYVMSAYPPVSVRNSPNLAACALLFVGSSLIPVYFFNKAVRRSEVLAWPSIFRPPCPAIPRMRPRSDDPLQSMFDTDLVWIGYALGGTLKARHDLGFWSFLLIWLIPVGLIFGQVLTALVYRSKIESI
jgi:hypothetical protein